MKESRSAKKPAAAGIAEPTVPPLADSELPEDGGIRLALPGFEGPLDLLLHLIQEHELDILNIPISFITKKYLEYIGLMEQLNIDIASEYLVMAATLAYIKSRMLLPTPPADVEEGEEEELDPRAELIRRLLEYQKYKKAGEELAARSVLGRDIFVRGAQPAVDPTTAPLAPVSSFKLLEAFQRILTRAKIVIDHQIEFERFSLSDRINQLVDMLKDRGRVFFDDLFEGQRNRADIIVTFLALLELTRLRMTRLFQEGSLEPIFIELSVTDEDDPSALSEDAEAGPARGIGPMPSKPPAGDGAKRGGLADVDAGAMPESEPQSLDDVDDELDDELDDFDLSSLGLDDDDLDETEGRAVEAGSPEPSEGDETDAGVVPSLADETPDEAPDETPDETPDEVLIEEEPHSLAEQFTEPNLGELAFVESDEQAIVDEVDAVLTAETPADADSDGNQRSMPEHETVVTDDAVLPSADSELELK